MSLFRSLVCFTSMVALTWSKPLGRPISSRQESELPPCGDIIAWVKNDYTYFDAHFVYKCLRDVPFDAAIGTRFLKYFNTTLQFHAPLDTLKSPPPGYQQPAVDVERGLDVIQSKIDEGSYQNQYQFEADVQRLIAQMHDAHVTLNAGILAAFSFASPYGIISASIDGKKLPEIYVDMDVLNSQKEGWTPSPIVKINGQDAIEYLSHYAEANAASYLEPHAEWNSLVESPVLDVLGIWSAYQAGTIYPGDEDDAQLNVEFENGTILEETWSAVYEESSNTGPLTTSGDFYNYFVLGRLPESWNTTGQWWPNRTLGETPEDEPEENPAVDPLTIACSQDDQTTTSWCDSSSAAFPNNPVVVQGELDPTYDEFVTGYILEDISTGVLSIPRFYSSSDDIENDSFRTAIQDFIIAAQEKAKRIVIDLQHNNGGSSFRAYDTFKLFFPTLEPYGASRTRRHELAGVLGSAYTEAFSVSDGSLDDYYAANEWVVNNRINADTNTTFSSWEEYFDNEGDYSRPQRYNLSDITFDLAAFPMVPWGYDPDVEDELSEQPFAAEDIVILTDGLCSSACAIFVEFMSQQAGVRTIVAGGRPQTGPMQAVSGSRGAASYSSDALDYDIAQVNETLQNEEAFARLPDRSDTGMWVNYAGISIRNQVRENDATPLQFQFQAADCRIFYTFKNVYNMTQLWRDTARAAWDDASFCVEGSTGYPSMRNNNSTKTPPPPPKKGQAVTFDVNPDPEHSPNSTFEIQSGPEWVTRTRLTYDDCAKVDPSKSLTSEKCMYMDVSCPAKTAKGKPYPVAVPVLRPLCKWTGDEDSCEGVSTCAKYAKKDTKAHSKGDINAVQWYGYCKTNEKKAKSQWCNDVAKTKTEKGKGLVKKFTCKPVISTTRVTEAACSNRMRIYDDQTFAVWTWTETRKAIDYGTCAAYTCAAPKTSELTANEKSSIYFWT